MLERILIRWKFDLDSRRKLVAIHESRDDLRAVEDAILGTPNPEPAEIMTVASVRERLGDHEGVIEVFESGARAFVGDHELRNQYAWYLQKTSHNLERGLSMIDEALRWKPDDPFYLDTKGMVLRAMDEPREAVEVFDDALAQPGGDLPAIWWHRALALIDAGQDVEGLRAATEVRGRGDLSQELAEEIEMWFWETGE